MRDFVLGVGVGFIGACVWVGLWILVEDLWLKLRRYRRSPRI